MFNNLELGTVKDKFFFKLIELMILFCNLNYKIIYKKVLFLYRFCKYKFENIKIWNFICSEFQRIKMPNTSNLTVFNLEFAKRGVSKMPNI